MKSIALAAAAISVALLGFGLLILFVQLEAREAVLAACALLVYVAAFASRRPMPVLLFAWVLALTYGKAFFVYPSADDPDFHGVYWIYSDIFLAGVIIVWSTRRKTPDGWDAGRAVWPWLIPLVVSSTVSTFVAIRSDWALFDLLRIAKLLLVAVCLRSNLGIQEWWACIAGIAAATTGQGLLAILQVALKSTSAGLLGLVGVGGSEQTAQAQAQTQAMYGAMGGFSRAYGTIGHPANLASYFLFTVPVLLGLALTFRKVGFRLVSAFAFIIGVAGLACTQSRGPWMFGAFEITAMLIALVFYRLVSARAIIILSGIGLLLSAGVLYRFKDSIIERFNRDYDESVELRDRDNATAMQIFADAPLLGVGLNNYSAEILDYDPQWSWAFQDANAFQRQFKSRMFVAPHDLYAFLLAEIGLLGLLSFLILVAGICWLGYRAITESPGPQKAVSIGLILGLIGQLAQSAINFSLWVDPLLFTLILTAALVARAPLGRVNIQLPVADLTNAERAT